MSFIFTFFTSRYLCGKVEKKTFIVVCFADTAGNVIDADKEVQSSGFGVLTPVVKVCINKVMPFSKR